LSIETFDPTIDLLTVTESAVRHFEKSIEKEQGRLVRLGTEVTGCSGYAYTLDIVTESEAGDTLLEVAPGLIVAVTESALPLVRGTTIDMVQEGVNYNVKFRNPNITGECGCGESFTVG